MDCESNKSEPITFDSENLNQNELSRLREKLRNSKEEHREKQRQYILKKSRVLKDEDDENLIHITKNEFIKLVKDLQSKKKVSYKSLNAIMNSLLENDEYISIFFQINGSLQALLRELSGQNEKLQLLSARCICNLALGDTKLSWKVLKASQPYLFAHLSGMNDYVKEACVIALGNFSRHGHKHIDFILSQNFFPLLINLLNGHDESAQTAAIYALTQIVYYGFDILSSEHFGSVFQACLPIYNKRSFSIAFLMSLLSACEECHNQFLIHKVHIDSLKNLLTALKDEEKEAVYYLRIVGNCIAESSGRMAEDIMEKYEEIVVHSVILLMKSKHSYLQRECATFIANFLNHPRNYESFAFRLVRTNFLSLLIGIMCNSEGWKNGVEFQLVYPHSEAAAKQYLSFKQTKGLIFHKVRRL